MDTLEGKGAVVTGAASRIGRAIATAFIEAGASVLLCDVNYRAVEVLARQLGDRAIGRFTDISDERQVAAALAAARATFGSLDIVVNCAAFGAVALGGGGVRIVGLAPGLVETPSTRKKLEGSGAERG